MRASRPSCVLFLFLGLLCAPFLGACGESDPPAAAASPEPARGNTSGDPLASAASMKRASKKPGAAVHANEKKKSAQEKKKAKKRKPRHAANERPLPAFEGRTLAGEHWASRSLVGKRALILFFNPEREPSGIVAPAVQDLAAQAHQYNFRVLGIGIGSTRANLRTFAGENRIGFPLIDDSDAHITRMLGLRTPLLALGVDSDGYVTFAHSYFDTERPDGRKAIADMLRESLRIPTSESQQATAGGLVEHPKAPLFETEKLDGGRFDLRDLAGQPIVLVFFLHTCPHCHKALEFLKSALAKLPERTRPRLVGISVQNRPTAVHEALRKAGLDYFEVLTDPGHEVGRLYRLKGGVPDITLIDADGHILYRMRGWREDRDPALMRIYLARLAGAKPPLLLSREGYTGNDVCAACHEEEHATWLYTSHAHAYDDLVTHAEDRNEECVSCHVVGFGKRGGYTLEKATPHLEGVGCETCHGRGGPHLSPDFVQDDNYASVCLGCHDLEHSLGFDYDRFLPNISHDAIADLSPEERAEHFGKNGLGRSPLPETAAFVGSDACQSCHASEFETWSQSPHAHALVSLEKKAKSGEQSCLSCHTTGYGGRGGFAKGADAHASPDLARVGCESCHGPGAAHVGKDAKRHGTIVSLGDKCDSCVILQICGSCHDQLNDPDFEFEVEERIERQRHGTIEPGTGRPLESASQAAG